MDLIKESSWHGIWAGTGVGVLLDCLVACMHALDLELWSCLRVRAMPFCFWWLIALLMNAISAPMRTCVLPIWVLLFVTTICCHSFLEYLFHSHIVNGPVSDLSKLFSVTRDPSG